MPTLDLIKSATNQAGVDSGMLNPPAGTVGAPPKPTAGKMKFPQFPQPVTPETMPKIGSSNPAGMMKEAMVKAAAEINRLQQQVEKQANYIRANTIAYNLAMDGRIDFSEVMEKTAELQTKNLDVIEEAIKLGYQSSGSDFGRVDDNEEGGAAPNSSDPITSTLLRLI